jgi:sugar lactone lactonase YvrE
MTASRLTCALLLAALGCTNSNRPPSQNEVVDPATPQPDPMPQEMRVTGFSTPESAIWDSRRDVYLVSNVDGPATERDDNGFISQVNPDGSMATLRWIDGVQEGIELSGPKGMCLVDDMLLVADIDQIRRFDRNTGTVRGSIAVPDAQEINDIACNETGKAWVSDRGTGKVHEIADVKVDAVTAVLDVPNINGLAVDPQGRVWGVADNRLFRIDNGKMVDEQTLPSGGLDGLVVLADGMILVSSGEANAILYGRQGELFEPLFEDLDAPADIGYDAERNRLLIPLFKDNAVVIKALP